MQKITPELWFNNQAVEAAESYVSTFPDSRIRNVYQMHDTPSGTVKAVNFTLQGLEFNAFGADTSNAFNPALSFHVPCAVKEDVDVLWKKLTQGGQTLMELGEYPFSGRYAWVQDRYGVSWQLIYSPGSVGKQKMVPAFMFTGRQSGKAWEALNFWTSLFPQSTIDGIQRYGKNEDPDKEGTIKYATFSLAGQAFGIMDSAHAHQFSLNESISFVVNCKDQQEVDTYWNALSAVPEAEACGWLKDKFGVSWQVLPGRLNEMMLSSDQEKIDRVTQALLPMKKLDLAELEEAYSGK